MAIRLTIIDRSSKPGNWPYESVGDHYPAGLGIRTGEESHRMLITLNSVIEQQSSQPFEAPWPLPADLIASGFGYRAEPARCRGRSRPPYMDDDYPSD